MLVSILANPNVAYVLLTIGVIGVVVEIYSPGGIVPGLTGLVALTLAFIGLGHLPFNWTGLGLILLAFVLLVLDLHVSGFVLSIAGVLVYIAGSLLLFSPPARIVAETPAVSISIWLVVIMTVVVGGLAALLVTAGLVAQGRKPVVGSQALIGKRGTALSDLKPEGTVRVQSETWTALAVEGEIRAGEPVEVVGISGLRLRVRRVT